MKRVRNTKNRRYPGQKVFHHSEKKKQQIFAKNKFDIGNN